MTMRAIKPLRLLYGLLAFIAFALVGGGMLLTALSFVTETLYWRSQRPLRWRRAAESLAASIASQERATGLVVESLDQLVVPRCAGLQTCFESPQDARKYAAENDVVIGASDGGRIVCFKEVCAPIDLGECNEEPCRVCSMLKRFDEACGAQLISQCGLDAGHQLFTGPMSQSEIHCEDGLVALTTDGGTVPLGPVRHVTLSLWSGDGYSFRIELGTCGSCEGAVRLTASGWVLADPKQPQVRGE